MTELEHAKHMVALLVQMTGGWGKPSAKFGDKNPAVWGDAAHDGVDYPLPIGTDLWAVEDGKGHAYGTNKSTYGEVIQINTENGSGRSWVYGHTSKRFKATNEIIKAGDKIALSGNTGKSTAPHLHLGLIVNRQKVDPWPVLMDLRGMWEQKVRELENPPINYQDKYEAEVRSHAATKGNLTKSQNKVVELEKSLSDSVEQMKAMQDEVQLKTDRIAYLESDTARFSKLVKEKSAKITELEKKLVECEKKDNFFTALLKFLHKIGWKK